eukprot:5273024-Pleurochrysis_carterae.AAC.1
MDASARAMRARFGARRLPDLWALSPARHHACAVPTRGAGAGSSRTTRSAYPLLPLPPPRPAVGVPPRGPPVRASGSWPAAPIRRPSPRGRLRASPPCPRR